MAKRKCRHSFVGHQCDGDRIVSILCAVAGCNARLSLGKSNDKPAAVRHEMREAKLAKHDDDWIDGLEWEMSGSFDWDVTRPLAEQWPWSPTPTVLNAEQCAALEEHVALTGPTDQGQPVADDYELVSGPSSSDPAINAFEPRDYASTQPWLDPGASARMADAELVETVAYAPPGSVRE